MQKQLSTERLEAVRKRLTSDLDWNIETLTLGAFLDRWLERAARLKLRTATYRSYEIHIRVHIAPRMGGYLLKEITPAHVQALYGLMEEEGASARTRLMCHSILRRALGQAVKWEILIKNPAALVDKPRYQGKRVDPFTPEETAKLLLTARSDRLYALYVLAVTAGLRQGELLGLQWDDIDLVNGNIHVRRQMIENGLEFGLAETKTAKGARRVDIPAMAVQALRDHWNQMQREGHGASLVFVHPDGHPYRKGYILKFSFWRLLKRAELRRIRFHDLRHTAATLLLSQGVHPKVVQERLGHSQISVTLDTYSHVLPSMQRDAADKLDALFSIT